MNKKSISQQDRKNEILHLINIPLIDELQLLSIKWRIKNAEFQSFTQGLKMDSHSKIEWEINYMDYTFFSKR